MDTRTGNELRIINSELVMWIRLNPCESFVPGGLCQEEQNVFSLELFRKHPHHLVQLNR